MTRKMDNSQIRALEYLDMRHASGKPGACLYMEMRMGKSWVGVDFIKAKALTPCLILTTAKAIVGWMSEAEQHPEATWAFVTGSKISKDKAIAKDTDFTVMSYESFLARGGSEAFSTGFKSWILDESYQLAQPGKKVTANIERNKEGSPFRILMSGSPYAESILQVIPQLLLVEHDLFGCTRTFEVLENSTTIDKYGTRNPVDGFAEKLETELKAIAHMDTREANNIGSTKRYIRAYVDMPDELFLNYNEAAAIKNPAEKFMTLWKATSGFCPLTDMLIYDHKFTGFLNLRQQGVMGKKQVVFCNFVREVRLLVEFLRERGINAFGMTGGTSAAVQREAMKEFASIKDGVIVLQEVAYKMGLDFSSADDVVYVSNSPSGDARIQSEDRIIHRNKTHEVRIWDILVKQGADMYIADLVQNKSITSRQTMSQGAAMAGRITR